MNVIQYYRSNLKHKNEIIPEINLVKNLYSLRRLNLNYIDGQLIRNQGTSSTQIINYDNLELSRSEMQSFLGSNVGSIQDFYDQSPNNTISQNRYFRNANAGLQPSIFDGSNFFTKNSRLFIKGNPSSLHFLQTTTLFTATNDIVMAPNEDFMVFLVFVSQGDESEQHVLTQEVGTTGANGIYFISDTRPTGLHGVNWRLGRSADNFLTLQNRLNTDTIYSICLTRESEHLKLYLNGVLQDSQTGINDGHTSAFWRLLRRRTSVNFSGMFGEIISYPFFDESIRTKIISNQMQYYSI